MIRSAFLGSASLLLLALAKATAQIPLPPSPPGDAATTTDSSSRFSPAVVVNDACCLVAADDRLVAEGHAYRANFTSAGMQFMPALGRHVPTAATLRLQLESIARAKPASHAPHDRDAAPRIEGRTVVYERGIAQERFAVGPDGIALSLHFPAPLPGDGDLLVRYSLQTDLPLVSQDEGGLHLAVPAVGGVCIGGVTGISADGARAAGGLQLVDGQLELRLPAEFVARAAYPLVLDPLITPERLVTTGSDVFLDVAFNAGQQRHLVVWQRDFAANQQLIRGQLVNPDGTPVGGLLLIRDVPIGTPLICEWPSVGNVASRGRFLVAWAEAGIGNNAVIGGVAVNATDGAVSGVIAIAAPPGVDARRPVVAGENGTDDDALVVWRETTGVRGATIAVGATGAPAVDSTTNIESAPGVTEVTISRSQPSSSAYLVAWSVGGQVRARTFDRNLQNPSNLLAMNLLLSGEAFYGISVDGDGTRFVLAWAQDHGLNTQSDLLAVPLRWTGSSLALDGAIRTVDGSPAWGGNQPRVGFLGAKFTIAWNTFNGAGVARVAGEEIAPDCINCGLPWTVPAANSWQGDVAVATERAAGTPSDQCLIVYADHSSSGGGRISAVRCRAAGAGVAPVSTGPGCGSAGTIQVAGGPFVLGNADFRIVLANSPPNGLAFINLAVGTPSVVTCGLCSVLAGGIIQYVPQTANGTAHPLAVPCNTQLLGFALEAQWLVLGAGNSPCPLVPNATATGRLRLVVSE